MLNHVWFVLLLLIWCAAVRGSCDTSRTVNGVHIVAVTSGSSNADTKHRAHACLQFNGYDWDCEQLENLPGNDYTKNKGNWWVDTSWNKVGNKLCDIDGFKLKNGGTDGWKFTKLIVLVKDNLGKAWVVVEHTGNKWLDKNGNANDKQHEFDIEDNIGVPNYHFAAASKKVIFMADTGGDSHDGSDDLPELHIVAKGTDVSEDMQDNPGDDMKKNFSDVWILDFDERSIPDINDIEQIYLKDGGDDRWTFDHVAVLIDTDSGWYVPVLDTETSHDLESDGEDKVDFTLLNNWKGQENAITFENGEIGGYWILDKTIDHLETATIEFTASFTDETSETIEESHMKAFENTFTVGTSFSLCAGADSGIASSEACTTLDFEASTTTGWEDTIMTSIQTRTSQTETQTCSSEFNCDCDHDVYLYKWVTYVLDLTSDKKQILETCEYNVMETQGNTPKCAPGLCLQSSHDCQECYQGPQLPQGGAADTQERGRFPIKGMGRRSIAESSPKRLIEIAGEKIALDN